MPGSFQTNAGNGVPNVAASMSAVRSFTEPAVPFEYPFSISLIAVDVNGSPLSGASVMLFRTADNSIAGISVSAADGTFHFSASPNLSHYIVAYLPGSPDVAGTTVDNLVGT